jgi:hypothetical protein
LKKYYWYVYRCEESNETRGRTKQDRAEPCGAWNIHKSRDGLEDRPRARCKHDHGDGQTRRKVLSESMVIYTFETRWEAEAKRAVLEATE